MPRELVIVQVFCSAWYEVFSSYSQSKVVCRSDSVVIKSAVDFGTLRFKNTQLIARPQHMTSLYLHFSEMLTHGTVRENA